MPQERYNTQWVRENGYGIVLDSFRSIRGGVTEITRRLPEFSCNVGRIDNRAVHEIPGILAGIVGGGGGKAALCRLIKLAGDRADRPPPRSGPAPGPSGRRVPMR